MTANRGYLSTGSVFPQSFLTGGPGRAKKAAPGILFNLLKAHDAKEKKCGQKVRHEKCFKKKTSEPVVITRKGKGK